MRKNKAGRRFYFRFRKICALSGCRGFSLLEVLVALAILALVLVALLRLELSTSVLIARSSLYFHSLILAVDQMEDLIEKKFQGRMEKKMGDYEIRARTEDLLKETLPLEKLQVDIMRGEERCADLELYRPK